MLLEHDSRKKKKAEAANIIHSSVHNALKVEVKKGGSLRAREAEVLFSITLERQLSTLCTHLLYMYTVGPRGNLCKEVWMGISGTEENILFN